MCRTLQPTFDMCQHREELFDRTIGCDNYPHCGSVSLHPIMFLSYCSTCFADPQALTRDWLSDRSQLPHLTPELLARVRAVFDLAAAPGQQVRQYPVLENGVVAMHSIDINILDALDGRLDCQDWMRLRVLEQCLGRYILMPGVPELTASEFALFCQIRAAIVASWDENARPMFSSSNRSNWISAITTDVPVHEGEECLICRSTLGVASEFEAEDAVKLPCGHVFGSRCIVLWADGKRHLSCPNCRGKYSAAPVVDADRPWWMDLFMETFGEDFWNEDDDDDDDDEDEDVDMGP